MLIKAKCNNFWYTNYSINHINLVLIKNSSVKLLFMFGHKFMPGIDIDHEIALIFMADTFGHS